MMFTMAYTQQSPCEFYESICFECANVASGWCKDRRAKIPIANRLCSEFVEAKTVMNVPYIEQDATHVLIERNVLERLIAEREELREALRDARQRIGRLVGALHLTPGEYRAACRAAESGASKGEQDDAD
jgi:hypothetical protein